MQTLQRAKSTLDNVYHVVRKFEMVKNDIESFYFITNSQALAIEPTALPLSLSARI
ncbi:hypothetical protein J6590_080335 [Homalodisca vitripennis]|nr:hypothetical protein J6590_080335 [Homalodisca vitripennis]